MGQEDKYEELSRKAEAGELTVLPSAEDLIDDLEDKILEYAYDYDYHGRGDFKFSTVLDSLDTLLANFWQDAYTQGITDQITSESTPEYAPNRPNPYKKDTNEH